MNLVLRCLESRLDPCRFSEPSLDLSHPAKNMSRHNANTTRDHPLTCTKRIFRQKLVISCLQTNLTGRDELSKVLYKLQQVKFFDEASELFVSKTEKNGKENVSRCNVEGITPTIEPIARMAPAYTHNGDNFCYELQESSKIDGLIDGEVRGK